MQCPVIDISPCIAVFLYSIYYFPQKCVKYHQQAGLRSIKAKVLVMQNDSFKFEFMVPDIFYLLSIRVSDCTECLLDTFVAFAFCDHCNLYFKNI